MHEVTSGATVVMVSARRRPDDGRARDGRWPLARTRAPPSEAEAEAEADHTRQSRPLQLTTSSSQRRVRVVLVCPALVACTDDDWEPPDYLCPALYGPALVVTAVDMQSGGAVCGLTVVAAATFSAVYVAPDEDACVVEVVGDDGVFDLAILAEGYELAKVVGCLVPSMYPGGIPVQFPGESAGTASQTVSRLERHPRARCETGHSGAPCPGVAGG